MERNDLVEKICSVHHIWEYGLCAINTHIYIFFLSYGYSLDATLIFHGHFDGDCFKRRRSSFFSSETESTADKSNDRRKFIVAGAGDKVPDIRANTLIRRTI